MERIFWVECPTCHAWFYANYNELRHAGVKLFCPACHGRFLPEEAASLDDRWQGDVAARPA
jgi:predicted Zn finger-like uncharacterized protein